jgi:putative transposase
VPWKKSSVFEAREQFVKAALAKSEGIAKLCQRFGISRVTGYRWLRRFELKGGAGLSDLARGPAAGAMHSRRRRWEEALLVLRRDHPHWGPKKLLAKMRREHARARLPSERTTARLLKAAQCVRRRKQRSQPGPKLPVPMPARARLCHAVWTVDFKGHFRTGDGAWCRPLTIRDLFSRYVLLVEHVHQPSEALVRQAMERCFRRHGLPRVIRVDNGAPFAGVGALQLSTLSVWWWRLGIRVEFTRRGKPQDNGAHEQMHRVLKQETARPPAASLRQQALRMRNFCRCYNEERPHQALGMRRPAELYRVSARAFLAPPALTYPTAWLVRQVSHGGAIKWAGRVRHVGRAFAGERVGLKSTIMRPSQKHPDVVEVHLGAQLIGELHRHETTGLRAAQWRTAPTRPRR